MLSCYKITVWFVILREVSWEDLAFFNADLFEGLSRMIIDGTHPLMTPECFQATYCCHFEVGACLMCFLYCYGEVSLRYAVDGELFIYLHVAFARSVFFWEELRIGSTEWYLWVTCDSLA